MAQRDPYQMITDTIVAQLETGVRPWVRPWGEAGKDECDRVGVPLRSNGLPYNGVNVLTLWAAADTKGFKCPTWMTFNQATKLGGMIRKGEKGERIVYVGTHDKVVWNQETGEQEIRTSDFLRASAVFNVEQIDGLPDRFYRSYREIVPINPGRRLDRAEEFFRDLKVDITHKGDDAYYVLAEDRVYVPPFESFHNAESYYATLAHETVHWTRHPSRVNRRFQGADGVAYAKEELVAEIGSAFLCADLDVTPEPREDHSSYIGAWVKALKGDKKLIFRAASAATKAVEWLHEKAPGYRHALEAGADVLAEGWATGNAQAVAEPASGRSLGMPASAVQGELFRSTPEADARLLAARDARAFVTDVKTLRERVRQGTASDRRALEGEMRRLLAVAERLDLGDPGVARAMAGSLAMERSDAAAGGEDAGRDPGGYVEGFQREAWMALETSERAEKRQHQTQEQSTRRGVSF